MPQRTSKILYQELCFLFISFIRLSNPTKLIRFFERFRLMITLGRSISQVRHQNPAIPSLSLVLMAWSPS